MTYNKSMDLFSKAIQLIPGGSQTGSKRPQAFAFGAYPIYASKAYGSHIEDVDGNTYIDLVSALGPNILGYNYHAVNEAVLAQLDKGVLAGLLWPVEVEAAELITSIIPCAQMVRYFKGGGEATAAAARLARAYTGREIILNCGYRGWPDVWVAAHNDGGVPKCLESTIVSFPFGDIDALEQKMLEYKGKVAAIFIDITARFTEAGDYLAQVKELAHQHGSLFVMDEIITGFRLAPGGAQEYFHVTPDLAVFAKGIANGMPLSCVVGHRDIMETMAKQTISLTYGGEALSLAASIACIKEIRDKNVPAYLWEIGRQLCTGLNEAAKSARIPFECHGLAPMTMMHFKEVEGAQSQIVWSYFLQEMAKRGVLLRRGGLNFVTFSHTKEDIIQIITAANSVFDNLSKLWLKPELVDHVYVCDVNLGHRSFA